jgi:arsenite-transporting ATPase
MDAPYEFYEQLEALEKVLTDNTVTTVDWLPIQKRW